MTPDPTNDAQLADAQFVALRHAELAALWRRQFEVFDDLVYGFLHGEVSREQLQGARHFLSVPRFYRPPTAERFTASDPLHRDYLGVPEVDFRRTTRETDSRFI